MILIYSMKKFTVVHHLFPYDLENASNSLYIRPLPWWLRLIQSHSKIMKTLLMVTTDM